MGIPNIILLIAGALNLAMSLFIISRGWKNKINLYFSLLTFFNFLWTLGLIFINAGITEELSRFFASFVYPVALLIIVYLFYFIVYFPYRIFNIPKIIKWLINLIVLGFTVFCLGFYKIFVYDIVLTPKLVVYYEFWSYSLFSFILILLMIAGVIILFYKYKKVESIYKSQLVLILIAVVIGSLAGSYFNLFLMYFHNCDYNYLGPLFTLFINYIVFYLIFLHNKKISIN